MLEISPELLTKVYHLPSVPDLQPHYNIAPGQNVAVIRQHNGGDRDLAWLQWGLIPSWAKEQSIGHKMINARCETVHEKPSFKHAFQARRCIIPASGFYEWEKRGTEKIPHYIHLRDHHTMSFAGLWEKWTSSEGKTLETCTILTTAANSLLKKLHDRMPVILHRDECDLWLDRRIDDVKRLKELFHPYPSDQLAEYVVSKEVNRPENDSPACITPLSPTDGRLFAQ